MTESFKHTWWVNRPLTAKFTVAERRGSPRRAGVHCRAPLLDPGGAPEPPGIPKIDYLRTIFKRFGNRQAVWKSFFGGTGDSLIPGNSGNFGNFGNRLLEEQETF